jgi:hypothetical protein
MTDQVVNCRLSTATALVQLQIMPVKRMKKVALGDIFSSTTVFHANPHFINCSTLISHRYTSSSWPSSSEAGTTGPSNLYL